MERNAFNCWKSPLAALILSMHFLSSVTSVLYWLELFVSVLLASSSEEWAYSDFWQISSSSAACMLDRSSLLKLKAGLLRSIARLSNYFDWITNPIANFLSENPYIGKYISRPGLLPEFFDHWIYCLRVIQWCWRTVFISFCQIDFEIVVSPL